MKASNSSHLKHLKQSQVKHLSLTVHAFLPGFYYSTVSFNFFSFFFLTSPFAQAFVPANICYVNIEFYSARLAFLRWPRRVTVQF